jgi:hypothetical protein
VVRKERGELAGSDAGDPGAGVELEEMSHGGFLSCCAKSAMACATPDLAAVPPRCRLEDRLCTMKRLRTVCGRAWPDQAVSGGDPMH